MTGDKEGCVESGDIVVGLELDGDLLHQRILSMKFPGSKQKSWMIRHMLSFLPSFSRNKRLSDQNAETNSAARILI